MDKKKLSLADALYMPGVADIDVEFPRYDIVCKPAEFDLGEEEISELDDLAGGEWLMPYDPVDDLTSEEAIAVFLDEAEKTGDPAYIVRAHEVAERTRATKDEAK
jgi:hypothetical protein